VSGATIGVAGVSFSWTASPGALGNSLAIQRAGTGEIVFSGSLLGDTSTSTLISLPNGVFSFEVRACSNLAAGTCGSAGQVGFSVDLFAPSEAPFVTAPARGAALTSSTHTLTWTPIPPNPALPTMSYEVVVTRIQDGTQELNINVPSTQTSTIFSFRSGGYRLQVRGCQAACGPFSSAVNFSVALGPVPTVAPAITRSDVSANSLLAEWTAVPGAELYQIRVVQPPPAGPGGGALTVAASQVSTNSVTLPVPPGNASVVVAACTGDGCGPFSTPASINPTDSTLTTANLGEPMAGTVVSGPTALLTWNRIASDTGSNTTYRLFIQDLSRQSAALDALTTNNFYAAYFKAEGAAYAAQVIANPGAAAPQVGPAIAFNVRGTSSTAPTIVFPANNSTIRSGNIQLGWSPVPGATLYQYYAAVTGQSAATATGVTTGLLVQVPLVSPFGATSFSAIARACPPGATCAQSSNAGWGPWSTDAGPGGNTFSVVP
jgi:hypothetical protein